MGAWDSLTFRDARNAYRLIGECRDLGTDPGLWQVHALEGLCGLFGAAAAGGEGRLVGPDRRFVAVSWLFSGCDASASRIIAACIQDRGPVGDPFIRALRHIP